jgi:GPI mannosyltransferase 3
MKDRSLNRILLVALFFHLFAAFFSTGFHHFDEHFQITEWLNFKNGGISGGELAWEYREKIRPWFQVFTYNGIYTLFKAFGIESPFIHLFILRLFTSLFGLYSMFFFYPIIKKWFNEDTRKSEFAFMLMTLAWYVPYIFVRTSSESFGISFFLLGTSLLLRLNDFRKQILYSLLAGLLFGLSYQARFQMAAMVAPLWFYVFIFKKTSYRNLALVAIGVLIGIGSGLVFDYWGYGIWNFSLWHYFRTNFLEGIMQNVQQYPFWWYIRLCFNRGIAPISLPLILATLFGWWKYRKHPLTWMTLPLFLFHSWVGHKELRYLFPIIIFAPLYLSFLIFDYREKFDFLQSKVWGRGLIKFVVGLNILFLFVSTFRPANPSVNFYKYLWKTPEIKKIYAHVEDPFYMLGLPINFYKRPDLEVEKFEDLTKLGDLKGKYLFFRKGKDLMAFENIPNCELLYLTYPRFTLNYNVGNWLSRSRVWSLFFCN